MLGTIYFYWYTKCKLHHTLMKCVCIYFLTTTMTSSNIGSKFIKCSNLLSIYQTIVTITSINNTKIYLWNRVCCSYNSRFYQTILNQKYLHSAVPANELNAVKYQNKTLQVKKKKSEIDKTHLEYLQFLPSQH